MGLGDAAWGVAVDGGFAFVTDQSGLQVIDIAEPDAPVLVASLATQGTSIKVAVGNNLAWLADGAGGYEVCDVSDPRAPVYLTHHALPEGVDDLVLDDSVLYLANRFEGLRIIDVTDPAAPVHLSPLNTEGRARSVAVGRKLVHVMTSGLGVVMALRHCSTTVGIDPGEEPPADDVVPGVGGTLVVYPNPFNPATEIVFTTGRDGMVNLAVFDLRGRLVQRLVAGPRPAGLHREPWDGRDHNGREAPAGVYLVRLETPTAVRVQKAALVK